MVMNTNIMQKQSEFGGGVCHLLLQSGVFRLSNIKDSPSFCPVSDVEYDAGTVTVITLCCPKHSKE